MNAQAVKLIRVQGGNRHPLKTKEFILEYLTTNADATIPEIHDAYKQRLKELALARERKRPYHWARYSSFKTVVLRLVKAGALKFTGEQEESLAERFREWPHKPILRFVSR